VPKNARKKNMRGVVDRARKNKIKNILIKFKKTKKL
jgi:hypothetical protein